jgi:hypothetical protein
MFFLQVFCDIPVPRSRCRVSTSNRWESLPSKSFTIHHSSIILTFNAILPYPLPQRNTTSSFGLWQAEHNAFRCSSGTVAWQMLIWNKIQNLSFLFLRFRRDSWLQRERNNTPAVYCFPQSCEAKRMQITTFSWPTVITLHPMDTILHKMAAENSNFSYCMFIKWY